MFDVLGDPLFLKAVIASIVVAIPCSIVGIFVVLKRLAYLGEATGHFALTGLAISLACGILPLFGALIFAVIAALIICRVGRTGRISADSAIGVATPAALALGVVIVSAKLAKSSDLVGLLFGNLLIMSNRDIIWSFIIGACTVAGMGYYFRGLCLLSFDEEVAVSQGVNVVKLSYILAASVAVVVVSSVRMVGAVMVPALLITPAATAMYSSRRFMHVAILTVIFSTLGSVLGVTLSFVLDLPSGATIVLMLTAVFYLNLIISQRGSRAVPTAD